MLIDDNHVFGRAKDHHFDPWRQKPSRFKHLLTTLWASDISPVAACARSSIASQMSTRRRRKCVSSPYILSWTTCATAVWAVQVMRLQVLSRDLPWFSKYWGRPKNEPPVSDGLSHLFLEMHWWSFMLFCTVLNIRPSAQAPLFGLPILSIYLFLRKQRQVCYCV